MEIIRSGRVHYCAPIFDIADAAATVQGFTTRHEGVSRPPYNSLNLGMNTDDSPHNVEGNRSILTRAFGIAQDRLVTVQQTHGSDILAIDAPNDDYSHFLELEADAIITNQPGVMIGVTVADCVPVLLFDPVKGVIGAVHAGWQGCAAQITRQAVQGMEQLFGSRPQDIQAAIGPCIGPCCYEVDQLVKDGFDKNLPPGSLWSKALPQANGVWTWHWSTGCSLKRPVYPAQPFKLLASASAATGSCSSPTAGITARPDGRWGLSCLRIRKKLKPCLPRY